ncbi:MAG: phosphoribosylanthranilate isomerase [Sedimentisphaerales bacterium]|nr:phosphoribosylanthranilate isomerase [Sedimentisphaerales bacterium]
MLIVKVKICGLTNYDDAAAAIDMGADLLGFNFYPKSPRYIKPEKAAKIIRKLPAFTDIVGVFVNEPIEKIQEVRELCHLDWVQLHGDEAPAFCNQFRTLDVKIMKAIRVKDQRDVESAENFFTDAILLDAFNPRKYGGTGVSFDWNIIGHIKKRIFLAGGINPGNAAKAVELGVYGIDVCSGVEARPGKKDKRLMRKLFESIQHLRG